MGKETEHLKYPKYDARTDFEKVGGYQALLSKSEKLDKIPEGLKELPRPLETAIRSQGIRPKVPRLQVECDIFRRGLSLSCSQPKQGC